MTDRVISHSFLDALTSPAVLWMLVILGLFVWLLFRPHAKEPLKIVALILGFAFEPFSAAVMNAENRSFPLKFDYFLQLADQALGVTAFGVARLFTEWDRWALFAVYQSLSAAMIAGYGVSLMRRDGKPGRLLTANLITFVAGPCLYLIVPACGPRHAFGSAFPMGDPAVSPVLVRLNYWPNAIPSLHVGTALLFVFFSSGSRVLRGIAWAYLAGTVAATLAFEYYVIDLVMAVPFTCIAAQGAAGRFRPMLANLAMALAWLLAIRFATPALIAYPVALRIAAIATMAFSGYPVAPGILEDVGG